MGWLLLWTYLVGIPVLWPFLARAIAASDAFTYGLDPESGDRAKADR
jgi:hypothetical protein